MTNLSQPRMPGGVLVAHPLALDASRRLDERHQRALSRYYLAAGADGLAVGVHTTQFAVHDPARGLYAPVLGLVAETVQAEAGRPVALVAGVMGPTRQAVDEAEIARALGYHLALVASVGTDDEDEDALMDRIRAVGDVLPVFAFYLQPKVGGRLLSARFWRRIADLEQVWAVKLAPFDRYQTAAAVTQLLAAGRRDLALYTGNDDHFIADLMTPWPGPGGQTRYLAGGLLGQWAIWTRTAVLLWRRIQTWRGDAPEPGETHALLKENVIWTLANQALFDADHDFRGSIAGLHEILRRQGLMAGRWCLNPHEDVSPGQLAAIDAIREAYPELADDEFVAEHLDQWLH